MHKYVLVDIMLQAQKWKTKNIIKIYVIFMYNTFIVVCHINIVLLRIET